MPVRISRLLILAERGPPDFKGVLPCSKDHQQKRRPSWESVYDFFSYLSSGAVVVATADYIWDSGLVNRKDVSVRAPPVFGVALILLTYVLGQIAIFRHGYFKRHPLRCSDHYPQG